MKRQMMMGIWMLAMGIAMPLCADDEQEAQQEARQEEVADIEDEIDEMVCKRTKYLSAIKRFERNADLAFHKDKIEYRRCLEMADQYRGRLEQVEYRISQLQQVHQDIE